MIGAFGTARLTFVCPNQDAFTYNRDTGQEWLIPPRDRQFIRPDPSDLLEGSNRGEPGELSTADEASVGGHYGSTPSIDETT